ncbi:MAG: response regulator [Desulfosarcinaceae bacterium]|jgi:DNA-binding NtrC family response regulator
MRVLIIDDETSIRTSMGEFLEDFGFEVTAVGSAEEALEAIVERSFDVAVVDIRLPGIDGDDLIIRAHDLAPTLHFIIHTGSVEYRLSDALKAIGLHKDHIFIKPITDLASIVTAIQAMAARKEQESS